jgi:hypothetical protein
VAYSAIFARGGAMLLRPTDLVGSKAFGSFQRPHEPFDVIVDRIGKAELTAFGRHTMFLYDCPDIIQGPFLQNLRSGLDKIIQGLFSLRNAICLSPSQEEP